MKDKFILKNKNNKPSNSYKPAIITLRTHNLLLQMKRESGLSMVELTEKCVKFAFDRMDVE